MYNTTQFALLATFATKLAFAIRMEASWMPVDYWEDCVEQQWNNFSIVEESVANSTRNRSFPSPWFTAPASYGTTLNPHWGILNRNVDQECGIRSTFDRTRVCNELAIDRLDLAKDFVDTLNGDPL